MKLIAAETGQAIQLISMDEVRPLRGGPFLPDLIAEIAQRYRFVSFPREFSPGQEIKFETGVAKLNGGETVPIRSLQIYSDGFLVTTAHTDDSDHVIDEFIGWSVTALQFRSPTTVIPRRYFSTVVVELDGGLDAFIINLESCREIVNRMLNLDTHVARISFAADPATPPISTWQIEPRIGVAFENNRYFSTAPLSTNAHLEMLAALEAAVK